MFRFEEDAFLRKGGDYSRNCLTFEDEEEEANKLALDKRMSSLKHERFTGNKTQKLLIGADGHCTAPLLKAVFQTWKPEDVLGEACIVDNQLRAFICPASRRPASEPTFVASAIERAAAEYLVSACDETSTLVILATAPTREQPYDFDIRILANQYYKVSGAKNKIKVLEPTRLLTSFAAAILELATINKVPAVCFIAPRETVLSRETLELFAELFATSELFRDLSSAAIASKATWMIQAIKADEKDQRRFEPEGMFM